MKKEKLPELLKTTQNQNILWMYLLQNDNDFNFYISKNKNCSLEILKILNKSIDLYIKEHVAQHPNCSLELLEQLCKDKDSYVRQIAQQKLNEKRRLI